MDGESSSMESGTFNAHLKTVKRHPTSPWYIAFVMVQYSLLCISAFYAMTTTHSPPPHEELHPLVHARHPSFTDTHAATVGGNLKAQKRRPFPAVHSAHALHQKRAVSSPHSPIVHAVQRDHSSKLVQVLESEERKVPEHVVLCYTSWSECDDKVLEAARNGCNVIVWFALNIQKDAAGIPVISGGPNRQCVADTANQLSDENLDVLHLVSFGGWDQKHPDDSISAEQVWATWKNWDQEGQALGFRGFDGIDWDTEGVDYMKSEDNVMSVALLNMIGNVCKMAKAEGYITSLAPMQSYLDPTTSDFSRHLTFQADEFDGILPQPFKHQGRNAFAYLLARFGSETFDIVFVQLYESYSKTSYALRTKHEVPSEYLKTLMFQYAQGWWVDFDQDPALGIHSQVVSLEPKQVVIGLANAWAEHEAKGEPVKAVYLDEDEIASAWERMDSVGLAPRGFGFWDIADEGKPEFGTGQPVYLAKEIAGILDGEHPFVHGAGSHEQDHAPQHDPDPLDVIGLKRQRSGTTLARLTRSSA